MKLHSLFSRQAVERKRIAHKGGSGRACTSSAHLRALHGTRNQKHITILKKKGGVIRNVKKTNNVVVIVLQESGLGQQQ
jgi:tRNA pseudouridine-54 N-methylase